MASSIFGSNGMVLATAMAAVSGTVILLAIRLQKQPTTTATKFSLTNHHPKPCISSIDEKKKKRVKKKKKVRFAEDVTEPSGNGEVFRKRLESKTFRNVRTCSPLFKDEGGKKKTTMPANRMALYAGILRDRGVQVQRLAYS